MLGFTQGRLPRMIGTVAVGIWLTAATSLFAQGGLGGGSTGGGSPGGGGGTTGGGGGLGGGGGGTGGGGGPGGGSAGGGGLGGGSGAGATSNAVDQTNFLRSSYSNPLYMGRPNQVTTNSTGTIGTNSTGSTIGYSTNSSQSGGFGNPSFGNSSSAAGATGRVGAGGIGAGGIGGGRAATTTGLGGRAGGGGVIAATQANRIGTRITYSATLKFPAKPILHTEVHAEVRSILDRSTMLKNPAGIQVALEDRTVVLRGNVADDDERRLVEGMIRLTPGVRDVRNELTVP